MTFAEPGHSTSGAIEVSRITAAGFFVTVEGRELFLAFADFPWFRDATVRQILHVISPLPGQYRWPDLDVDISVESMLQPKQFPLISRDSKAK